MDHEYNLEVWAESTSLGRRVFNHNYRMSGRELQAWKMVKQVTMPAVPGVAERVYLWQGKSADEQDLVRIGIAELGDWRSAQMRLLDELNHSMRPQIPRGTGTLARIGDVNLVARDPLTDASAAIFFTRGNVCATVRSVGEVNVDISDIAMALVRSLSEPPTEKELQKGLVRRRPPVSAVLEPDQAHVLIEDLAKETAPDEWLKVIAPEGELGRRGDALVLVSAEGGTIPISIFSRCVEAYLIGHHLLKDVSGPSQVPPYRGVPGAERDRAKPGATLRDPCVDCAREHTQIIPPRKTGSSSSSGKRSPRRRGLEMIVQKWFSRNGT